MNARLEVELMDSSYPTPIDKEDAQEIILNLFNPDPELTKYGDAVAVDPSVSYETSNSWIFYVNSRKYIENGERQYRLSGIRLIAVEKKTGRTYSLGTGEYDRLAIARHESMFYPSILNRLIFRIMIILYYAGIRFEGKPK